jgi:ABC-type amino acid transport substrate-binding protein
MVFLELPPFIILKDPTVIYSGMTDKYKRINLTEFDGFYKDVLLSLQKRMGFIPVITLAKPTTQYNELVEAVANGLFDTVMSTIIITEKRRRIVDFSTPLIPSSIRVVIRKPKSNQLNPIFFLNPFSWQLWIVILATVPLNSFLVWYFERQNGGGSEKRVIKTISSSSAYILNTMLNRGSLSVESNAGRFLTYGLYIVQTILFSVYTASLLSYIITQSSDPTLSGIDDIKNGRIPPKRIGVVVGSAVEEYYLNSVSQGKKDFYPLQTADEVYTSLRNGYVDAALWNNLTIGYHTNNVYCDLMPTGVEFSLSSYQLPVKKDWLYKADLDSNILLLIQSEELDKISEKWFKSRGCGVAGPFDPERKSITLQATIGIFIILLIFIIAAIIIHCWTSRNTLQSSMEPGTSSTPAPLTLEGGGIIRNTNVHYTNQDDSILFPRPVEHAY